ELFYYNEAWPAGVRRRTRESLRPEPIFVKPQLAPARALHMHRNAPQLENEPRSKFGLQTERTRRRIPDVPRSVRPFQTDRTGFRSHIHGVVLQPRAQATFIDVTDQNTSVQLIVVFINAAGQGPIVIVHTHYDPAHEAVHDLTVEVRVAILDVLL